MITDRAEALRMAVSIMNTCSVHNVCHTCPFADTTNKNCVVREALDAAIDNLEEEQQKILKMLVVATKGIVIPVKDDKEAKEKEQKLQKSSENEVSALDAITYAIRKYYGPKPQSDDAFMTGVCKVYSDFQFNRLDDAVNHPNHYQKGGLECIDVIRAAVSNLSGFEAYCVGNIVKYVWRYKEKNG